MDTYTTSRQERIETALIAHEQRVMAETRVEALERQVRELRAQVADLALWLEEVADDLLSRTA